MSVAIVYSNDRKALATATQTSQVKNLQSELRTSEAVQKLQEQANTADIKNAGDTILTLNQQKTTLCNQIKAAKLAQPLCN